MSPRALTFPALLLALTAVPRPGHAQKSVELSPFVAYRVGGGFQDFQGRDYDVSDNMSYGGTLDLNLGGYGGSFLFSHQDSDVHGSGFSGSGPFDLKVDDWMIGGWRQFGTPGSKLQPVATGYLGLTHFSTSEGDIESADRFTFATGLGGKYLANERVGLRLDARGYFTFANGNAGAFCSGGGCALSFAGDLFFQADLAAAVVIRLGGSSQ